MISLGAIESAIGQQLPEDSEILATTIPDDKKGEKVAMLFAGNIEHDHLKLLIDQSELNPLMRPALLVPVEAIPKLGSGKSNFSAAKQIALETAAV